MISEILLYSTRDGRWKARVDVDVMGSQSRRETNAYAPPPELGEVGHHVARGCALREANAIITSWNEFGPNPTPETESLIKAVKEFKRASVSWTSPQPLAKALFDCDDFSDARLSEATSLCVQGKCDFFAILVGVALSSMSADGRRKIIAAALSVAKD